MSIHYKRICDFLTFFKLIIDHTTILLSYIFLNKVANFEANYNILHLRHERTHGLGCCCTSLLVSKILFT